MSAYISYLNDIMNKNEKDFAAYAGIINWVRPTEAVELEKMRNKIILSMKKQIKLSFNQTKPWYNQLSKGCELCGKGLWSCLFVGGSCNASCFFCPSRQDQPNEVPSSQMKDFETPAAYAAYIRYFGFKGVSFSGGEPMLDFKKTLSYSEEIRNKCAQDIYIWLYTNGIEGRRDQFKSLAKSGIDEVRFNLCASGYDLNLLEKASKYIPNLTVEIPAIPHDYEKLKQLLPRLVETGVKYLNLHTLRPTLHNIKHLLKHQYTFAHGEGPVVIDSEITALKVMKHAIDNQLNLGINYCSYQYKFNFQKSGYRRIIAEKLKLPHQEVTQKGYLRSITIKKGNEEKYITRTQLQEKIHKVQDVLLNYQRIDLINYDPSIHSEVLTIKGQSYGVKRVDLCDEIEVPARLFLKLLEISSPESLKLQSSVRIFQLENLESGLPYYY